MMVTIRHLSAESAQQIYNFIYTYSHIMNDNRPRVEKVSHDRYHISFTVDKYIKMTMYEDLICISSIDSVCKIPRWEFSEITIM